MKINEDLLKNINGNITLDGSLTVTGDLNNNTLDMFNDTRGSNWKELLKNKIDYCITNIDTSKENAEVFINGGWFSRNYGFGLFSKIGNWYQLIWFCNFGIYYCSKNNNTSEYVYKQIEFDISNYERIVATYNGKPLYRKSYTVTGDDNNVQRLFNLSDVDTIVNLTGWVKNGSTIRNVNTCYYGNINWASQIYFLNNGATLECGDLFKAFKNGATIYITIEYTKTTD